VICPRCQADNKDGRKFCTSCGAPLVLSCSNCGSPVEAGDRFCAECGTAVQAAAPAPEAAVQATAPAPVVTAVPAAAPVPVTPGHYAQEGVEERRIATVMFADLAGFTAMSEGLDPEDVKALASHCSDLMSAEVRRFGGTVTGIMGDAIMATFGAPIAHEDDAERAIRAALAMRERIRAEDIGPRRLDLHIGINTGETMAGLIGPQGRQDYVAMGDTTNTAARMMGHAPTGSIFVGEQTYLATLHSVVYRQADPIAAKGKSEPVRVWEVLEAPPVPQPRPLGSAPFVGRREELATVVDLWAHVRRDHRPCSLTLVGPAGIGKTRLLHVAMSALDGDPPVLWGRCLPYGEGITYWPLIEMVSSAAEITYNDVLATKLAKLGRLIESLPTDERDQVESIAIALANLLALPTTPRGTLLASQVSRTELHWGIRRFVELLSARGPLALVFEDLHWSEPTLRELIGYLEQASGAFLMVASSRPEGLEDRTGTDADRHRVATLAGLTDREAAVVLSGLVREDGAEARLEPLLRAAQGNPLFLEETLRMLASSGALDRGGNAIGRLEEMPIPTSVQGLIGSRLDLLPPDEKRMAQHGSVIGQTFWSGAVAYIGGWPGEINDRLEDLHNREVVQSHENSEVFGEHEYSFRHILIRDVAYGRLPKRERADLHAACATWLDQHLSQRDELVEIIAYHWEQACRLAPRVGPKAAQRPVAQAVEALIAAAARAEYRDGAREAERFCERALALLDATHAEMAVELRVRRARAREMLGALSEAETDLRGAAEDAQRLGRRDLHGQALVTLAAIHVKLGRFREAERELLEARSAARELGDRHLELRADYELAELLGDFEGKTDLGIEALRQALPVAAALGDRALAFEGHLRLATQLFNLGKLAEAEVESTLAEDLASAQGSHRDRARATFARGLIALYRSGPEQARPITAEALLWNERVGDHYYQLQSVKTLAKCDLSTGSPERAEARLRAALPLADQAGGWLTVELRRYLIEALVELGRTSEAATTLADARRAMPPEDDYAVAALLLAEALVSSAGPDPDRAWSSFAESMQIMANLQLWLDHAEAQILYARALARGGFPGRAENELREARTRCEQLQADALITDIDRELARLAPHTASG
jgi:class 3 adenylate cyclase/tetratricopeptide (TPR) repeat protein